VRLLPKAIEPPSPSTSLMSPHFTRCGKSNAVSKISSQGEGAIPRRFIPVWNDARRPVNR
jgi:hypothetical protein